MSTLVSGTERTEMYFRGSEVVIRVNSRGGDEVSPRVWMSDVAPSGMEM